MNSTSPMQTLLALTLGGVLVCLVIFRPNTVRRLFGVDNVPGNDGEVQVFRDKLRARAESVAKEMGVADREYRRHEREVHTVRRAFSELMQDARLQDTEYPALWKEAGQRADLELVAEFYSLQRQVAAARRDLATGGNPNEWAGIVDEGRNKAQRLAEDTQRRQAALLQLKEKFVRR